MEKNLYNILEPLCSGVNSAALIIVRNGDIVTVASRGEGASVFCSIDYATAQQSVADTLMDAVVSVTSLDKPNKKKTNHGKDC